MSQHGATTRVRSRITRVLVALSVVAISLGGLLATSDDLAQAQPLRTLDLPTWDDVQAAKKNQAAAAKQVREIEALIIEVQNLVEETRAKSEDATASAVRAEEEYLEAHLKAEELEKHAAESEQQATEAADQAAALVSQMYRSGGVDRNMELFLETDGDTADVLLDRLAMMSKATERNTSISEEAQQAMNNARSLGEQAEAAQLERERLHVVAEEERVVAAAAADSARVELSEQEDQEKELQAQLAALKDETTDTVAGYEERLRIEEEQRRKAEEERIRRAEEERQRQIEDERRRQEAQQSQGGGSSGGGGGSPGGGGGAVAAPPPAWGGWVRPLPGGSYYVSTEWWGYFGHQAVDLAASKWTPIYASTSGTVTIAGWWGGCGNTVHVQHGDGTSTRYCHMEQSPAVGLGQWVGAGQILGYVGTTGISTGDHLHFETHVNGIPVDPRPFMNARGIWL